MSLDLSSVKSENLQFNISSELTFGDVKEQEPQRFSGIGYTGEAITNHPYWGTVAFDLSQMNVPNPMPILLNHDPDKIVGWSQGFAITERGLELTGILSKSTEHGREVTALSKEGFPWQMSVRISPSVIEEILAGESTQVNGRTITGPAYVFRKSKLSETSFTPMGWDDKTSATALSLHNPNQEDAMSKEQIKELEDALKAKDDAFSELQTKFNELQAKFDELTQTISTLEASKAEEAKTKRLERIKLVFSVLGQEATDTQIEKLQNLDEEAFAVIEQSAAKAAGKLPEQLFEEFAKQGNPPSTDDNFLVKDAERRAQQFAKR